MLEIKAHVDTEHVTRCMAYLVCNAAASPLVVTDAYFIRAPTICASGELGACLDLDKSHHIEYIIHLRELGRSDTLRQEERRPPALELDPVYTKLLTRDNYGVLEAVVGITGRHTQYEYERTQNGNLHPVTS